MKPDCGSSGGRNVKTQNEIHKLIQKEMIDELSRDPYIITEQTENVTDTIIEYLQRKLRRGNKTMLDIGRRSPLTDIANNNFNLEIYNTEGDLDAEFSFPDMEGGCDYILYSHTIEHQFNPLYTLLQLKKIMAEYTVMFIILPNKPKLLWWEGHFHEIDRYRMQLLLKRAGLTIVSYERHRAWRNWKFYFTGIRPFLRLFCEYNAYYEVKL